VPESTLIRHHKRCQFIQTAGRWPWKSESAKECVRVDCTLAQRTVASEGPPGGGPRDRSSMPGRAPPDPGEGATGGRGAPAPLSTD
jgi:hypothetical protein